MTMNFNSGMPPRGDYIEVVPGMSIQFNPDAEPWIMWGHIDGPLLHMRDGQIHWLTLWERLLYTFGCTDEFVLERKYATPGFVDRWNIRRRADAIMRAARERAPALTEGPQNADQHR